jgi:diadenosine tetraphosphatase ApaH/serine/threonine PP2A family protein phosphatase
VAVLGDTIGYGPNPRECLERVRGFADVLLIGNHEKEATFPQDDELESDVREMLDWTLGALGDLPAWQELRGQIRARTPEALARREEDGLLFVHASPQKPYVQYVWPGYRTHFLSLNRQLDEHLGSILAQFGPGHSFCGHTHSPAVATGYENRELFPIYPDWNRTFTFWGPSTIFYVPSGEIDLEGLAGRKAVINPGSVGQPRDHHPAASYALYNGDVVRFRRVDYDVAATQAKIAALPVSRDTRDFFATRLGKGE